MAPWDDDGAPGRASSPTASSRTPCTTGYGTGNTFRGNVVVGSIPGFGVGLYPAEGNVVTCDNEAPGAAGGLVGDRSKRRRAPDPLSVQARDVPAERGRRALNSSVEANGSSAHSPDPA